MDVYGLSATPEVFRIDDLLDFSNEEIFSSKTTNFDLNHHYQLPPTDNSYYDALPNSDHFTDKLCFPSDDVAELEWLSNMVEDSSNDFPSMYLNTNNNSTTATLHSKPSRSKRSRSTTANTSWTSSFQQITDEKSNQDPQHNNNIMRKKESSLNCNNRDRSSSSSMSEIPRKCTHCASEKTPQWRTGPLGPKTLCNACGVRYKSGRLVPEYRPAASPTFVLTQHSNSHRKVMELRRQKEVLHQQQQGMYVHHYQVC